MKVIVILFIVGIFSKESLSRHSDNIERIVGGESGIPAPFFAQIFITWKYYGGGSIISNRIIVTAAQCLITNILDDYRIFLGDKGLGEGDEYRVLNTLVHPEYNRKTMINDIGIIMTTETIYFYNNVDFIHVHTNVSMSAIYDFVMVYGYGSAGESSYDTSETLHGARVRTIDNTRCIDMYKEKAPGSLITDNQFCSVPDNGRDACYMDRGGPTVFKDNLYGIISWSKSCAHSEYPRVHTHVTKYQDWLEENMVPIERPKQCQSTDRLTQFYTVSLTKNKTMVCICTIINNHAFLTSSSCIPSPNEVDQYQIYHEQYYDINSYETGANLIPSMINSSYDMIIVKVTKNVTFLMHYEAPPVVSELKEFTRMKWAQLIKHQFFEDIGTVEVYPQNEQVDVVSMDTCQKDYADILPIKIQKPYFCIKSECIAPQTELTICSDLGGAPVFTMLDELVGLVVWQSACNTHGIAVVLFLPNFLDVVQRNHQRSLLKTQ